MKVIEIAPGSNAWVREGNVMTAPCGDRVYKFTIEDDSKFKPTNDFPSIGALLSAAIAFFSKDWQIKEALRDYHVKGELTWTEE